ncbi:helix-turn-helix transcriptional regulator [Microscilla marina]|uniref:Putative ggdef family protein n=1 Tax=Microscilla marina ATCC 23134 TaxID=313606 RepID=A1ZUK3_MICM2|nr:hypothetical protein [Microscilla marina]EAY25889.1 putative ggdef family protein [Microscilla marina ATCC 23134]
MKEQHEAINLDSKNFLFKYIVFFVKNITNKQSNRKNVNQNHRCFIAKEWRQALLAFLVVELPNKRAESARELYTLKAGSWELFLMVFVLSMMISIIHHLKRKIKKNKKVHKQQKVDVIGSEKEQGDPSLEEKELAQLNDAINFKNQQLLSYALHMIQKNQSLTELKGLVAELKQQDDIEYLHKLLARVNNLADYGLRMGKDWDNFQLIFEQFHSSFHDTLKKKFPDLTANDLHLCVLIRLGMSVEDMADLLGIAPESLRKKRYRLRQKMNIDSVQGLGEFLKNNEE